MLTSEDVGAVPLGVYHVAAVLKADDYDVEILNWHDIHATPEKVREVLAERKPDIIGFSILNGNRWGALDIARTAKQIDSRVDHIDADILSRGLTHFPDDARLNTCMGVSLMNRGQWDRALSHFLEFQSDKDAVRFAAVCYESLGDKVSAAAMQKKFEQM